MPERLATSPVRRGRLRGRVDHRRVGRARGTSRPHAPGVPDHRDRPGSAPRKGASVSTGPVTSDASQLIARLRQRGYSLAGIGDLLGNWSAGADLGEVLGLEPDQLVHVDEPGAPATLDQLHALLPAMIPDHLDGARGHRSDRAMPARVLLHPESFAAPARHRRTGSRSGPRTTCIALLGAIQSRSRYRRRPSRPPDRTAARGERPPEPPPPSSNGDVACSLTASVGSPSTGSAGGSVSPTSKPTSTRPSTAIVENGATRHDDHRERIAVRGLERRQRSPVGCPRRSSATTSSPPSPIVLLAAADLRPGSMSSTSAADVAPPPSWQPRSRRPRARRRASTSRRPCSTWLDSEPRPRVRPTPASCRATRRPTPSSRGPSIWSSAGSAPCSSRTRRSPSPTSERRCGPAGDSASPPGSLSRPTSGSPSPGAAVLHCTEMPASAPDEPGMFGQSDPDLVTGTLRAAGFIDIGLEASDILLDLGETVEDGGRLPDRQRTRAGPARSHPRRPRP